MAGRVQTRRRNTCKRPNPNGERNKLIVFLLGIILIILCLIPWRCSEEASPENRIEAARRHSPEVFAAGREFAIKALKDTTDTARVKALLDIHAREQRLRAAGMAQSAEAFAAGAGQVIDSLVH